MSFKKLVKNGFDEEYREISRVFYLRSKRRKSLRWSLYQNIFKIWCVFSFFYRRKNRSLVEIYDHTLLRNPIRGNALDIGTGSMWIIRYWENRKGKYFVGIDPMIRKSAPKVIKKCKNSCLVEGVAESLPFKSDVFDEVIINSMLDHIENPKKALKESYRVLVKNGRLRIITIVSKQNSPISPHISNVDYTILRKMLEKDFMISSEMWMDKEKRILYLEAVKN